MKLIDLIPALDLMANNPPPNNLRAISYLTAYPSLLALAKTKQNLEMADLHEFCLLAYGWMPRIAILDPDHTDEALIVIQKAHIKRSKKLDIKDIDGLRLCLHSFVGASKVLHLIKPTIFPIWDSNIEWFRQKKKPTQYYMRKAANYESYFNDVQSIRADSNFNSFYKDFNKALAKWLSLKDIKPYKVSEVRAIELAAFELSRKFRNSDEWLGNF